MTYASNYANRATIFDAGDTIDGDHVRSIYDELGPLPGSLVANLAPSAVGYWYAPSPGGVSTSVAAANSLTLVPWVVSSSSVTVDRVAVSVTSAGSTGSVIRLGVYGSTDGRPSGSPVADWGPVTTETTGVRELTISTTVDRGVYWLAAVAQGSPTTYPTTRVPSSVPGVVLGDSAASVLDTGLRGFRVSGVTGTLGSISATVNSGTPILVAVRYA